MDNSLRLHSLRHLYNFAIFVHFKHLKQINNFIISSSSTEDVGKLTILTENLKLNLCRPATFDGPLYFALFDY